VYVHGQQGGNVVVPRSSAVFPGHARLSLCLVEDVDQQPAFALFLEH
jgi:hypothetical protein